MEYLESELVTVDTPCTVGDRSRQHCPPRITEEGSTNHTKRFHDRHIEDLVLVHNSTRMRRTTKVPGNCTIDCTIEGTISKMHIKSYLQATDAAATNI